MNLLVRLIATFLSGLFKRRIDPLDTSVLSMRVWPNDIDLNLHLTNGRYLSMMDLGRFDLVLRTGLLGVMLKRRWRPIVAAVTIKYRRALAPFASFRLHSRVIAWDDKWIFFEQRFERGGSDVAVALVKGIVRGPKGNVPTSEVVDVLGITRESPPVPDDIRAALL